MENFENKSLEQIRKEFLFENGSYTKEQLNIIRDKILEEDKIKNPIKYKEVYDKLNTIVDVNNELSFKINKQEMFELIEKKLLELKATIIAYRMSGIELSNPVSTLNDIEIYTLLYNYLKNDKELEDEERIKIK